MGDPGIFTVFDTGFFELFYLFFANRGFCAIGSVDLAIGLVDDNAIVENANILALFGFVPLLDKPESLSLIVDEILAPDLVNIRARSIAGVIEQIGNLPGLLWIKLLGILLVDPNSFVDVIGVLVPVVAPGIRIGVDCESVTMVNFYFGLILSLNLLK